MLRSVIKLFALFALIASSWVRAETRSVLVPIVKNPTLDTGLTAWELIQGTELAQYFADSDAGEEDDSRIPRRASPRVSLVVGSHTKRRVSFVWRGRPIKLPPNAPFSSFRFKHRWTEYSFATGVVDTAERGRSVQNKPTRGLLLADVCISSRFVPCTFGRSYDTLGKLSWILNTLSSNKELDFWVMGGDNLYDEDSSISKTFFDALSFSTLRVPIISVPGNHDFWTRGAPSATPNNQFGFGYLQWYMMDSEAAHRRTTEDEPSDESGFPFSFDEGPVSAIPSSDNFFHYSSVGNVGFIAFSGAHPFQTDQFSRACKYFAHEHPGQDAAFVFLVGHWSTNNMGCEEDMYTARVFEVMSLGSKGLQEWCLPLFKQKRLYFVDGHFHDNKKLGEFGMRVAGMGMIDTGAFGFPLVEVSTESDGITKRMVISYVALARSLADPLVHFKFNTLRACARVKGSVFACLQDMPFVETWVNSTARPVS